jgi:uncharacterized cupin superfamily protein
VIDRMRSFNVASGALERTREDRDGWRASTRPIGAAIGAQLIGGSVYELEDGERTWPFHYHHGVEEWLVVISGTPTVRLPDGERVLAPGDVVCFPSGPEGAHAVRGPGRVLMLSANRAPSISVYPDSDKIGTRPESGPDRLNFRRGDAVDYWEGEG